MIIIIILNLNQCVAFTTIFNKMSNYNDCKQFLAQCFWVWVEFPGNIILNALTNICMSFSKI